MHIHLDVRSVWKEILGIEFAAPWFELHYLFGKLVWLSVRSEDLVNNLEIRISGLNSWALPSNICTPLNK